MNQREGTQNKTKRISRIVVRALKEMEGEEIFYNEESVGLAYPFIYCKGKQTKLTANQWKDLWFQYWNHTTNDGYWLMKDAEKEFGGVGG